MDNREDDRRRLGGAHHPLAWMRSHATRRRGVSTDAAVPDGANEVLERLADLPLSVWTYRFDHESVRHLGPMAQDFAATFALGSSDRVIAQVDANGVCMASIQALYRRLVEVETELDRLRVASGAAPGTRGTAASG
ncbi:tail fiber domain-containing protein [Rhodococcus sp. NPDC058505]|uniref:tail fiber domain-containing protein n=1 Tax=unclassified Rhodococcus (in: high G+C Gram-positive bacteria) TaxID=192944 RepID=UPI00364F66C8